MATINQTPDPSALTPEDIRAACDAFLGAIDAAQTWLAAYRAMVERLRASGTLAPDEADRALLATLEPSAAQFATMDALDALRRDESR